MGTLQIARTTQLQVSLGNAETIVGLAHDVDALAGVGTEFQAGDENAVRLVSTTTYTTTKLMQLGESEALSFEDDHHGGIGHVDTHLNDGSGNENLSFATDELLHLGFLVGRLHLAVNLAESELRENLS